jgi:hypothetical protein
MFVERPRTTHTLTRFTKTKDKEPEHGGEATSDDDDDDDAVFLGERPDSPDTSQVSGIDPAPLQTLAESANITLSGDYSQLPTLASHSVDAAGRQHACVECHTLVFSSCTVCTLCAVCALNTICTGTPPETPLLDMNIEDLEACAGLTDEDPSPTTN